jgi:N-acetylglucosamine-6-phosphate deacetylase
MQSSYLLSNGRIFDGREFLSDEFSVLVEPPFVASVTKRPPANLPVIDLQGKILTPGYVDLQVNGGGGSYVSLQPSPESFDEILKAHLSQGTTSMLLTLTTSTPELREAVINSAKQNVNNHPSLILGIHLEGPFLNPKKKGAHNEPWLQKPSPQLIREMKRASGDLVKVMTVAPELLSPADLEALIETGWVLSAGHSNASYEEAQRFFDGGGTMATHLFNTMPSIKGREPGLMASVFEHPNVAAGIITDGHHVHPASIRLAWRNLKERLFLVSDAIFLGQSDGEVHFGYSTFRMENGTCYNLEGRLAGSSIAMAQGVQYCITRAGLPVADVLRMATYTPAKMIQESHRVGQIADGRIANMLVLNEQYLPERIFFEGKEITQKP